ncbi:hypothetical protein VSDG_04188 [Cytospora chrysosperma]|uniref:Uncharacterized protein n=1 Tax=Cytospora chrysosperma TaxID=252740 RepID=A0A423W111_CYTCH|nr:hypothetical protein VSDG_04188 [Valsa sordida]
MKDILSTDPSSPLPLTGASQQAPVASALSERRMTDPPEPEPEPELELDTETIEAPRPTLGGKYPCRTRAKLLLGLTRVEVGDAAVILLLGVVGAVRKVPHVPCDEFLGLPVMTGLCRGPRTLLMDMPLLPLLLLLSPVIVEVACEARAYSYADRKSAVVRDASRTLSSASRARYCRTGRCAGLWSRVIASGSSRGLSAVAPGAGGARVRALASIRFGSSEMTVLYCRFGRSGEFGDAHPGCSISPQTALCGGSVIPILSSAVETFFSPSMRKIDLFLFSRSSAVRSVMAVDGLAGATLGLDSYAIAALLLRPAAIILRTLFFASPLPIGIHVLGMFASAVRPMYSRTK